MNKFKEKELADSGAMLLGRKTYEIFAGSWPKETGDFAERFNALPKHIASSSLQTLDWQPAELLKGPLPDAVRKLRAASDGNIYVHGSLSIAHQLLLHGLVDRIRLLSYPGAVGEGKPFFPPGERHGLEMISATRFANGVLALEYVPEKPKSQAA